jgi:hypothetical protein
MPHPLSTAMLALAALCAGSSLCAQECISLEAGARVSNLPEEADGISLVSPPGITLSVSDAKPTGGVWQVTQPQIDRIKVFVEALEGDARRNTSLRPSKSGTPMAGRTIRFAIPPDKCSPEAGAPIASNAGAPNPTPSTDIDPATAEQCFKAASTWSLAKGRYRQPVLFNSAGAHCYTPPVLRQGDLLVVGMVLRPGEKLPNDAQAEFGNCTPEDGAVRVFPSGDIPAGLKKQSARQTEAVSFLGAMACGTQAPTAAVRIGTGETSVSSPHTLSQFQRYQATFHLGAVYTDLHNPDFGLRDDDGQNVIFNKDADKRGPEYVAMVVVQGISHYFRKKSPKSRPLSPGETPGLPTWEGIQNPDTWPNKGRDPVHDGEWLDKVGLVLSAGLDKPGERFGIGLSFEIARGLNIVGLYEMAKIKDLDGFEIGDPFTGAIETLPTRKEWESKASLGLTFDLAYVTKLFGGGT